MRCEACEGTGMVVALEENPARRFRLRDRMMAVSRPCEACGGSGVAHCCDGLRAQPERDP